MAFELMKLFIPRTFLSSGLWPFGSEKFLEAPDIDARSADEDYSPGAMFEPTLPSSCVSGSRKLKVPNGQSPVSSEVAENRLFSNNRAHLSSPTVDLPVELILGSQSPRRREILNFFTLPFKQVVPLFDEEAIPFRGDPREHVQLLASGKAESLSPLFPSAIILTADTLVYRGGKIYGKPRTPIEGLEYLKALSGDWHSVFTGLSLYFQGEIFQATEETRVLFHQLTEKQMRAYHSILEFSDKAGGYMIQGSGSVIVKRIEGCYYNVAGLPINALASLLRWAGIDLWQHLKYTNEV